MSNVKVALLTAILLTPAAAAQTDAQGSDLSGIFGVPQGSGSEGAAPADPNAAEGNAAGGLSRNYPITLTLAQLDRAGATPSSAYLLLRDLKGLMRVQGTEQVTLRTPGYTLSYRKGSRQARVNGLPATLNATPVNVSETSLFPLAALKLLGCSYEPLEPMKTLRTYAVSCPGADESLALQAFIVSNKNPGPGPLTPAHVTPRR